MLLFYGSEKPTGLIQTDLTECCGIRSGDPSISPDVLDHHLLLLDQGKSTGTDILGLHVEPFVEGLREVTSTATFFAADFNEPTLMDSFENPATFDGSLLDQGTGSLSIDASIIIEFIEEEFIKSERASVPILLENLCSEIERGHSPFWES
jgi:hypothetical protein